jgi:hypothetical protein
LIGNKSSFQYNHLISTIIENQIQIGCYRDRQRSDYAATESLIIQTACTGASGGAGVSLLLRYLYLLREMHHFTETNTTAISNIAATKTPTGTNQSASLESLGSRSSVK